MHHADFLNLVSDILAGKQVNTCLRHSTDLNICVEYFRVFI